MAEAGPTGDEKTFKSGLVPLAVQLSNDVIVSLFFLPFVCLSDSHVHYFGGIPPSSNSCFLTKLSIR